MTSTTAPDAPLIARTIAALDSYAVDEFGEADDAQDVGTDRHVYGHPRGRGALR